MHGIALHMNPILRENNWNCSWWAQLQVCMRAPPPLAAVTDDDDAGPARGASLFGRPLIDDDDDDDFVAHLYIRQPNPTALLLFSSLNQRLAAKTKYGIKSSHQCYLIRGLAWRHVSLLILAFSKLKWLVDRAFRLLLGGDLNSNKKCSLGEKWVLQVASTAANRVAYLELPDRKCDHVLSRPTIKRLSWAWKCLVVAIVAMRALSIRCRSVKLNVTRSKKKRRRKQMKMDFSFFTMLYSVVLLI